MTTARAALGAILVVVYAGTGGHTAIAHADANDLTIERLIGRPASPGTAPVVTTALRSAYAGLASELGVVLAPRPLQPADSLGWSGFSATFDTSSTQVNRSADYWRRGVENVGGSYLTTIGATVRKGLWLAAPQLELSFGGHDIVRSGLYTLDFAAKLALHEGFHRWPIPSIAVRVAVSHLFGSRQLGLTVIDSGIVVSKRFALAGALQLDPYVGASALVVLAQSRVIDTTPDVDSFRQTPNPVDENATVRLPDPGTLPRVRIDAGLRLRVSLLAITAEVAYVTCNGTGRHCDPAGDTTVKDRSRGQLQVSLAAGLTY